MQELADNDKIKANNAYIEQNYNMLLSTFAPAFCFHADEDSFPTTPDDYIKDVIIAKYDHYTFNMLHPLPEEEKKELALIEKYFIIKKNRLDPKKYEFNPNYGPKTPEDMYEYETEVLKNRNFLTFDEKKYGYRLGSKVPILGIHPGSGLPKAPIYTSIIATPTGARIKYEYFYALSGAIPSLKTLYQNLPYALSKSASHFAVHAGDWEGVEIDVKIDHKTNEASINGMQTFAHGTDGARFVKSKDLTYNQEGRACVFVGQSTHPSYADNFIGRNKFMDKVGHKFELVPEKFIALGPILPDKTQVLPKWAAFEWIGDSQSMIHSSISTSNNYQELQKKSKEWNRYKPMLFFTKIWDKIKNKVNSILGNNKAGFPGQCTIKLNKPLPTNIANANEISQKKHQTKQQDMQKLLNTILDIVEHDEVERTIDIRRASN